MVNRAAIILKYTQKAVNWINDADPVEENPGITIEKANDDRMIYLISEENADDPKETERWLKANYETLFEVELDSWYVDKTLWPKNRTYKLFKEWFQIECHTMIEDTVGTPIIDDDLT